MTKKVFKDNDFTDEFVSTVREKYYKAISKASKEYQSMTVDYLKLMEDENCDVNAVKKFIKKHSETLKKEEPEFFEKITKAQESELLKVFQEEVKEDLEKLKKQGADKESIKQKLAYLFDTNKKKFEFPENVNDNSFAKSIKSTVTELKAKSAAKWAAGAAAVLGMGTYAVSKLTGSKEQA